MIHYLFNCSFAFFNFSVTFLRRSVSFLEKSSNFNDLDQTSTASFTSRRGCGEQGNPFRCACFRDEAAATPAAR